MKILKVIFEILFGAILFFSGLTVGFSGASDLAGKTQIWANHITNAPMLDITMIISGCVAFYFGVKLIVNELT